MDCPILIPFRMRYNLYDWYVYHQIIHTTSSSAAICDRRVTATTMDAPSEHIRNAVYVLVACVQLEGTY